MNCLWILKQSEIVVGISCNVCQGGGSRQTLSAATDWLLIKCPALFRVTISFRSPQQPYFNRFDSARSLHSTLTMRFDYLTNVRKWRIIGIISLVCDTDTKTINTYTFVVYVTCLHQRKFAFDNFSTLLVSLCLRWRQNKMMRFESDGRAFMLMWIMDQTHPIVLCDEYTWSASLDRVRLVRFI